ncbi:MAG: AMP-dependent synthetase [Acetobacteraceae bacterium]|nr:AMP-dependent synthetase [Acetobacteraceae bacterium]
MSGAAFKQARDFLFAHRADYVTAHRDFRWPVQEYFNYALDWFDAELARGPLGNSPALRIVGEGAAERSFKQLSDDSSRLANGLRALGMKRGERILLMLGNVAPLWETMLAAQKLGAVVIPATTLLNTADLKDRFDRGRVRHVIANGVDAAKFGGLDPSVSRIAVGGASGWTDYDSLMRGSAEFVADGVTRSTDPMLLYFTSGTTAKPKLVLHDQQSYPVGHLITMHWIGLRPGDVHLNISSPGWAKHAYSCYFAPWNAGACVFINNQPRFNARGTLEVMAQHGVQTFCAPPTVWRMLVQEDMAPFKGSLRELVSAGEPLNPEVIEHVRRVWGMTIREGYGQTETTLQIGYFPGQDIKPGSMGHEAPGYRIRLLDSEDKETPEGEVSILLDHPPLGLMRGYQQDDGSFTPLGTIAYRTGDVATRDAEGHFTYVGRADDVFKASDYRISPFELESVLVEHEAVAEAAVVPAPDAVRMAVPKAFIALAPGANGDRDTMLSIFRHVRERLSPFKRVRRLEVYDLPKTISGKIRRVELRQTEEKRFSSSEREAAEWREEDFPELK